MGFYGRAGLVARITDRMSLGVGYTHRRYSSESDLDVPSVAGGLSWRAAPGSERDAKGDDVGTGRLERSRPSR